MKDRLKRELSVGDIVEQIVNDGNLPKGSRWEILGFGIEPSSMKQVAVMKDQTKGYNPYSKMRDDMIHQVMLSKSEQELMDWLNKNYDSVYDNKFQLKFNNYRVVYRKVKYLKAYGFVDWDFKNPNTIANKRKEKINDLSSEIKELRN